MSRQLRTVLVAVVGLAVLYVAAARLVQSPAVLLPRDFLEYWSAGIANLRGENPYDPETLFRYQKAANPNRTDTVMMWNPPWSLAVYMPLGLLPANWATLLWIGLQLAAVMLSCDLLWRAFGGPPRFRWVAQLVGLTFVGAWAAVSFGQNTGLILLGLAGYAYFRKAGRPAAAGAFAALTALKPHLLAVFGVLLILDAANRAGRIVLVVGAGLIVASLGAAVAANPHVLGQFRAALRDPGPGAIPLPAWVLPVPSYWFRVWLAPGQFWIQFVPCVAACAGYAGYRLWRGRSWDAVAELPAVVWVSVLVAPYGGWIFDLAVLLVPLMHAAVRVAESRRWAVGGALLAVLVAITVTANAGTFELHQYSWLAPAVLAVYLAALLITRPGPGRLTQPSPPTS